MKKKRILSKIAFFFCTVLCISAFIINNQILTAIGLVCLLLGLLLTEKIWKGNGILERAFPVALRKDLTKVIEIIPYRNDEKNMKYFSEDFISYKIDGTIITFPYRIYVEEPEDTDVSKLTEKQKMILHCIYSRSFDGFVRQKHIELLLHEYENWCIPYIFKVCDEYVLQIIEAIYNNITDSMSQNIKRFCLENELQVVVSYSRMVSYWNEFYRNTSPDFKTYVGRKLFLEHFGFSKKGYLKVTP